jgi:hypothetical protein
MHRGKERGDSPRTEDVHCFSDHPVLSPQLGSKGFLELRDLPSAVIKPLWSNAAYSPTASSGIEVVVKVIRVVEWQVCGLEMRGKVGNINPIGGGDENVES